VLLRSVDFVLAYRLDFEIVLSRLLLAVGEFLPYAHIGVVLVFLEHVKLLGLLHQLLFLCYLPLPLLLLLVEFALPLPVMLLLHKVFQDALLAKDMTLIAYHWLHDLLCAERAHIELFLRVLPDTLLDGAVHALEHLPLTVGEDVGAGVVLGVLAH